MPLGSQPCSRGNMRQCICSCLRPGVKSCSITCLYLSLIVALRVGRRAGNTGVVPAPGRGAEREGARRTLPGEGARPGGSDSQWARRTKDLLSRRLYLKNTWYAAGELRPPSTSARASGRVHFGAMPSSSCSV